MEIDRERQAREGAFTMVEGENLTARTTAPVRYSRVGRRFSGTLFLTGGPMSGACRLVEEAGAAVALAMRDGGGMRIDFVNEDYEEYERTRRRLGI